MICSRNLGKCFMNFNKFSGEDNYRETFQEWFEMNAQMCGWNNQTKLINRSVVHSRAMHSNQYNTVQYIATQYKIGESDNLHLWSGILFLYRTCSSHQRSDYFLSKGEVYSSENLCSALQSIPSTQTRG